jgi:hypothetical protein
MHEIDHLLEVAIIAVANQGPSAIQLLQGILLDVTGQKGQKMLLLEEPAAAAIASPVANPLFLASARRWQLPLTGVIVTQPAPLADTGIRILADSGVAGVAKPGGAATGAAMAGGGFMGAAVAATPLVRHCSFSLFSLLSTQGLSYNLCNQKVPCLISSPTGFERCCAVGAFKPSFLNLLESSKKPAGS